MYTYSSVLYNRNKQARCIYKQVRHNQATLTVAYSNTFTDGTLSAHVRMDSATRRAVSS